MRSVQPQQIPLRNHTQRRRANVATIRTIAAHQFAARLILNWPVNWFKLILIALCLIDNNLCTWMRTQFSFRHLSLLSKMMCHNHFTCAHVYWWQIIAAWNDDRREITLRRIYTVLLGRKNSNHKKMERKMALLNLAGNIWSRCRNSVNVRRLRLHRHIGHKNYYSFYCRVNFDEFYYRFHNLGKKRQNRRSKLYLFSTIPTKCLSVQSDCSSSMWSHICAHCIVHIRP